MGREIKRVALDFDWPLNKVWEGYLNPLYKQQVKCPHCDNGYSAAGELLNCIWYRHRHEKARFLLLSAVVPPGLREFAETILSCGEGWSRLLQQCDVDALVDGDRLWDFTRRQTSPEQECYPNGWTKEPNGYRPTAEEVNEWSKHGLGHDYINLSICASARAKMYRVSTTCEHCGGTAYVSNPELEAQIEAWKPTEPPAGEGYQCWETVSEGSPISPVFDSAQGLAQHMAGTRYGADKGTSYETWLKFIEGPGWAPTMVSDGKGLRSGVEATVNRDE